MSALESRGFVGDYGDRAAPRLTSEDSYKREWCLVFSFSLLRVFSRPDLKITHSATPPPLKKNSQTSQKTSKGAMRGVNVVAMEELSEEAIAAARSRRMRER